MTDDIADKLADGRCVPADGEYLRLTANAAEALLQRLPEGWKIVDGQLQRTYGCDTYLQAAEFTNQVARLAEQVNHHPALVLEWRQVGVSISTHAVAGLAEGDFVFAAKTELIARQLGIVVAG